jgi:hypothetical protein
MGLRGDDPDLSLQDWSDDFDYDDFMRREFGWKSKLVPGHLPWKWWIVGIILLVLMVLALVLSFTA